MMKRKLISILLSLVIAFMTHGTAFAQDRLTYRGNPDGYLAPSENVGPGTSNLMPVGYGGSNDRQYPGYSTFMQSPYSYGNVQQLYPMGVNPATANQQDPLNASEVSPYSRYSPYIEIVGEGSNYSLGIDDVVTIIVRNQPDFSGRFVVDPEGNVQYNFVGDIAAVGLTKGQLKQEVVKRLKKFVRYPEVAVMISEYRSKAVFVFGFVNRPGKYAMKGDQIFAVSSL